MEYSSSGTAGLARPSPVPERLQSTAETFVWTFEKNGRKLSSYPNSGRGDPSCRLFVLTARRMEPRRFLYPIFTWAALAVAACDNSPDEASKALARQLVVPEAVSPPTPSASTSGRNRLYIDASRSMVGFAGCTSPTEFNTTIDRLTSDLGLTTVVRFGERVAGSGDVFEEIPTGRAVHCPAFFDRLQNPDYALYEAAREDSTGAAHLYLTDGVQSDWQGSSPGPSIQLLKQWVRERRGLAILAFTSRFAGPAWSEQRHQMLPHFETESRPYYLFVLAPNDQAVDSLIEGLSSATRTRARTIQFRSDGLRCSLGAAPGLAKFRSSITPPWALVKLQAVTSAAATLAYRCDIAQEYPLEGVTPRTAVEYRRWNGGDFSAPVSGFTLPLSTVRDTAGGAPVLIKAGIVLDPATRYGFYGFRARPISGELRPWIADMSTDDDSSPDQFGRTYRFAWLIEQLAREDLAGRRESSYALTVQYR